MPRSWRTKLIHTDATVPEGFRSLVPAVHRASTTLFPDSASAADDWHQDRAPYSYGTFGTPTTLELAARVAELEGGMHTFLTPGGLAAISLVYLAFTKSGDHVLVPDSAYSPNRNLGAQFLRRFGIEVELYEPSIGAGIAAKLRDNTSLVWVESPGSVTFEVQDVPAIAAVAHARNAIVACDNTWAAGVMFDAFAHGADVTIQALTKYIGGHSDLLLGSVTVRDAAHYERVGDTWQYLGFAVSPDDCSLALRGMKTLAVRLDHLERSTLAVARWLAERPEIERVLHPALPSCDGHAIWKRDFTGSSSTFGVVFHERYSQDAIRSLIDGLELFEIGWSWGGVTSLAVPMFRVPRKRATVRRESLIRLNIGLEDPADLIADLEQGLTALPESV